MFRSPRDALFWVFRGWQRVVRDLKLLRARLWLWGLAYDGLDGPDDEGPFPESP